MVGSSHLLVTPHKRAASYREEFQEQFVWGEPSAGSVVIWMRLVELGRISHSRELCSDEVPSRTLKSHKCSLWISIGPPILRSYWQWSSVNQKRITTAPGYPKTLAICPLFPSMTERRGDSEEWGGTYHALPIPSVSGYGLTCWGGEVSVWNLKQEYTLKQGNWSECRRQGQIFSIA